jgi:hypothetical protein
MAFLLRTVSHSAEGREIVRARRSKASRLTIGRDPQCDVHLTDLAVALRHASAERRGRASRCRRRAGLSVELNGRKTSAGTIDLASGGDILIGSHLLRFMPPRPDRTKSPSPSSASPKARPSSTRAPSGCSRWRR